jgi:hypothetical protein
MFRSEKELHETRKTKEKHITDAMCRIQKEAVQKVLHVVIASEAKQSRILLITGLLRAAPSQ